MRKFTPVPQEKPKVLTTRDMKPTDMFQIEVYRDWWHRVDDSKSGNVQIASLLDGILRTGETIDIVIRVLAPGDSLTIGPEVKDGSASDV